MMGKAMTYREAQALRLSFGDPRSIEAAEMGRLAAELTALAAVEAKGAPPSLPCYLCTWNSELEMYAVECGCLIGNDYRPDDECGECHGYGEVDCPNCEGSGDLPVSYLAGMTLADMRGSLRAAEER